MERCETSYYLALSIMLATQQKTIIILLPNRMQKPVFKGKVFHSFKKKEDPSHQSLHLSLGNINFSSSSFSTDRDVITFYKLNYVRQLISKDLFPQSPLVVLYHPVFNNTSKNYLRNLNGDNLENLFFKSVIKE